MHVVMLSSEYPPRWGGMGSTVYHLSAALASLGHKITIITRNGQNTAPALEGVEVLTVPWKKYQWNLQGLMEGMHLKN